MSKADFVVGEYVIYANGETLDEGTTFEIGRIKSLRDDGAFVAYHEGETGAKTPYHRMHKLTNAYCVKETTLGGEYFKEGHNDEW